MKRTLCNIRYDNVQKHVYRWARAIIYRGYHLQMSTTVDTLHKAKMVICNDYKYILLRNICIRKTELFTCLLIECNRYL